MTDDPEVEWVYYRRYEIQGLIKTIKSLRQQLRGVHKAMDAERLRSADRESDLHKIRELNEESYRAFRREDLLKIDNLKEEIEALKKALADTRAAQWSFMPPRLDPVLSNSIIQLCAESAKENE